LESSILFITFTVLKINKSKKKNKSRYLKIQRELKETFSKLTIKTRKVWKKNVVPENKTYLIKSKNLKNIMLPTI